MKILRKLKIQELLEILEFLKNFEQLKRKFPKTFFSNFNYNVNKKNIKNIKLTVGNAFPCLPTIFYKISFKTDFQKFKTFSVQIEKLRKL